MFFRAVVPARVITDIRHRSAFTWKWTFIQRHISKRNRFRSLMIYPTTSCKTSFYVSLLTATAAIAFIFKSRKLVVCEVHAAHAPSPSPNSQAGGASKHTCVFVRVHNPSDATLNRLRSWAHDLQAGGSDLWISVNTTSPSFRARERVEAAVARWPTNLRSTVKLHFYCQEDMLCAYPVLIELLAVMPLPVIPGGGHYQGGSFGVRDLGWGCHAEAINIWFQKLHQTPMGNLGDMNLPVPQTYHFIWVLEDDVGFSGNLFDLIRFYLDDEADLITGRGFSTHDTGEDGFGKPQPRVPGDWRWPANLCWCPGGWAWYYMRSVGFRQRIEARAVEPRSSGEHVQRFSARFLHELHDWSSQGASAWSEMFIPTACVAIEGLKVRILDSNLVGDPFSFHGRVSAEAWNEIVQNPAREGKLFHALKF